MGQPRPTIPDTWSLAPRDPSFGASDPVQALVLGAGEPVPSEVH